MDRIYFHQTFTKEFVSATGIVAINGAYLDLLVGQALAKASGKSVDIAANSEFGEDTRKKCEKLAKIEGLPADVYRALKMMKSILADRNFAIHGVAAQNADGSLAHMRMRGKAGQAGQVEDREQAWIDNLIARIAEVSGILLHHFLAAQGDDR